MKKLNGFFILLLVMGFFALVSCLGNYSSSSRDGLLTANTKDALVFSLPKSLFKWAWDTNKEQGKSFSAGRVTWEFVAKSDGMEYVVTVIDFGVNFISGGDVFLLDNSHYDLIKKRSRIDIKKEGRANESEYKKGLIAGIPYVGLSSVAGRGETITLLLRNMAGNICVIYLSKLDYRNPIDLVGILKQYAKINPNYVKKK